MPRRGELYNALSGTKSDYDNMRIDKWWEQGHEPLSMFEPMVKNPLSVTNQRIYDQDKVDREVGRQSEHEELLRKLALDPEHQFGKERERQRQIRMNPRQPFDPWRQHE